MRKNHDGIVIGAGIMGVTAAMQLAETGLKRLLVLDKGPGIGFGSTGKSSAIFRQTYSFYETTLMAHEALQIVLNWRDFIKLSQPRADFRRHGVVFLFPAHDEHIVERLMGYQRSIGVRSELLDAQQCAELLPDMASCANRLDLEGDDHHCGGEMRVIYEPDGGCADPIGTTEDVLEVARSLGVEVHFRSRVSAIHHSGGRVRAVEVESPEGRQVRHTPLLVNCAGPWAVGLNAQAGVPLRQRIIPIRTQAVGKRFPEQLKKNLPILNDLINGFNMRPDATGTQVFVNSFQEKYSHEEVPDPDDYQDAADADFRESHLLHIHHRIPTFYARGDISSYSGLYSVNVEDNHPVIDHTELDGFFTACGFSGHGFKLAPVVGMLIARKITGQWGRGKTTVPLDFFNRNRKPLHSDRGGFFY